MYIMVRPARTVSPPNAIIICENFLWVRVRMRGSRGSSSCCMPRARTEETAKVQPHLIQPARNHVRPLQDGADHEHTEYNVNEAENHQQHWQRSREVGGDSLS